MLLTVKHIYLILFHKNLFLTFLTIRKVGIYAKYVDRYLWPSASGKTLFSKMVARSMKGIKSNVITADSYYKDNIHLSYEERCKINYDHPDSIDYTLLCKHMHILKQNLPVSNVPKWDYTTHGRSLETKKIPVAQINILEGILLFANPKLRDLIDVMIFVDTPLDICLIRRLKRDVMHRGRTIESVIEQYEKFVRPMYWKYIEPSKKYSHLIVPRGGKNSVAIEIVKSYLESICFKTDYSNPALKNVVG